jgi:hypothetical protein
MNKAQLLTPALLLLVLTGCDRSVAAEGQNWVEVPLSANTFRDSHSALRRGTYDIYVAAHSALEFKLHLEEGDSIVYEWEADMSDPALLTAEFHGHTERTGDAPGTVMFYKIHKDGRESGTLTAPFRGIHGWYLDNTSSEHITVVLTVAGFYEDVDQ